MAKSSKKKIGTRARKPGQGKEVKKKPKVRAAKPKRKSAIKFWLDNKWAALTLLLLPFLIYYQGIGFGYILDDVIVLSENKYVKEGISGLGKIFATDSFAGFLGEQEALVAGARYRPLSIATFAIEYGLLGELNPRISHIINIVLYALTGLLIFRLLSKMIQMEKSTKWFLSLGFVTALLFILHPVHVEAVANIKGRDEIMALLCSLAALYGVFEFLDKKSWLWLGLGLFSYFLGLLAKENTITFLAVIPLSIFFFRKKQIKDYLFVLLPLLVVTAIYLAIRIQAVGALFAPPANPNLIMNNNFRDMNLAESYATVFYTLGLYLKLLVFPHPLTHDYYPYHIPIMNWLDWRTLLSFSLYLGLGIYALWGLLKKQLPAWCIWYYLATLSIVSNIFFSVGTFMSERFIYMPSLGAMLLLSYLLLVLLKNRLPQQQQLLVPTILIGVLAIGFFIRSYTRVPVWENELTLNRAAIEVSKNSARANQFMGYALYRQSIGTKDAAQKKALLDEATPYIDKALSIVPDYKDAIKSKAGLLAGYYQRDKDLDKLLNGFYVLLTQNHVNFIDQYMEYLNPRADSDRLLQFYHRTGFELFWKEQQNTTLAQRYLNYGFSLDNTDQTILEDLCIFHYESGNTQQARTFLESLKLKHGLTPRVAQIAKKM